MFKGLTISAAICALALVTGCKNDDDGGQVKTLDDFAAGQTTGGLNACGDTVRNNQASQLNVIADTESTITDADVATYRSTVDSYFSALPSWYSDYYINKLRGLVILTDDKNFEALCVPSKSVAEERKKDITACYGYQQNGPGDATLAVIHRVSKGDSVENNNGRILHGGIRAFGMVFAQFVARHQAETDAEKIAQGINVRYSATDVDANVRKFKKEFASRFVADVVKSGKYKVSTFAPILGSNLTALESKAHAYAAAIDAGTSLDSFNLFEEAGIPSEKAQQFMDYALGEAFDSAYCSSKTVAEAKAEFSRTMGDKSNNVFQRLEQSFQSHATNLAKSFSSTGSDEIVSTGFGLQSMGCPCCNGGSCSGGCCCPGGCTGGNCNCTCAQNPQIQQAAASAPMLDQRSSGALLSMVPFLTKLFA